MFLIKTKNLFNNWSTRYTIDKISFFLKLRYMDEKKKQKLHDNSIFVHLKFKYDFIS
jgi:hypothetical protein